MLLIFLALVIGNYKDGGPSQVIAGGADSWKFFISRLAFPLLMAVLITGQVQELVIRHKEFVEVWLTGGKGIIGGVVAGVLAPLGITMLTTVKYLWEGGIADRGVLLTFLMSTTMLNICITTIRWPLLGGKVMVVYLVMGFFTTGITALFLWLFGKYIFR
ncbi:MAG: hypothetical protein NT093_03395 [Candidatus Moranbacteria bacterium]|nr:hypothetical protein [Candidatus Moranbacteria bacterium]